MVVPPAQPLLLLPLLLGVPVHPQLPGALVQRPVLLQRVRAPLLLNLRLGALALPVLLPGGVLLPLVLLLPTVPLPLLTGVELDPRARTVPLALLVRGVSRLLPGAPAVLPVLLPGVLLPLALALLPPGNYSCRQNGERGQPPEQLKVEIDPVGILEWWPT